MPIRRDLIPKEQREWLGVPSLELDNTFTGDNLFTGSNTFSAPLQAAVIASATEMTLVTPEGPRLGANATTPYVWLDLTGITGIRTLSFPDASGTLAMVGGALTLPYRAVTGTYTVVLTDGVMACNGTFTVTLPAAASCAGQLFIVKNAGVGVVTVDGDGAETIDGAATATVAAAAVLRVASNGANWLIL